MNIETTPTSSSPETEVTHAQTHIAEWLGGFVPAAGIPDTEAAADESTADRAPDVSAIESLERLLQGRWSCRGFRPDPVPRTDIERILGAAQRTPSWSNVQPWQVTVVSGPAVARLITGLAESDAPRGPDFPFPTEFNGVYGDRRRASGWALYNAVGVERGNREQSAAQVARNFVFFDAPHVAIITTDRALGTYGAIDCGLYVQTFLLAAQALGIAAIPQAALAARASTLRDWLGLGEDRVLVCAISFGYADLTHPSASFRTDRADLAEAATFIDE
jgi:nitroreductase